MKRLTKKEEGFVKNYIKSGNGTKSVLGVYDTNDYMTAAGIAAENLKKPKIQKAIADMLPDDLLSERHLELLNKREVFRMFNGEGQMIDQPDTQAVSKGLDMAYKIKGTYAPERSVGVRMNIETKIENEELEKLRKEYEDKLKSKLIQCNIVA